MLCNETHPELWWVPWDKNCSMSDELQLRTHTTPCHSFTMLISTNSILSFTTTLAILPSALGASLTALDRSLVKKRDDVNYVWSIANGDIAPVRITFNFNTISTIRNTYSRMATLALPRL